MQEPLVTAEKLYAPDYYAAFQAFQPAQTIEQAKKALLGLPGAQEYESTRKLVADVISSLDATGMQNALTYFAGMSEARANSLFNSSDFAPQCSPIQFSESPSAKITQHLVIGNFLAIRYRDALQAIDRARASGKARIKAAIDNAEAARQELWSFSDFSTTALFDPLAYEIDDRFRGIDPEDRRKGTVLPDPHFLSSIKEIATQMATPSNPDDRLEQLMRDASGGGDPTLIHTYLKNYRGKPELRRALEALDIQQHLNNDQPVEQQIQLMALVQAYRQAFGVDLDTDYVINGLPPVAATVQAVEAFLEDPKLIAEAHEHLRREAPQTAHTLETTREKDELMIWEELANQRGYGDALPDPKAALASFEGTARMARQIFPLIFGDIPGSRSIIELPGGLAAAKRQSAISYPNQKGDKVLATLLNPLVNEQESFFALMHEGAHVMHDKLLELFKRKGVIKNADIPDSIKELFSAVLEEEARVFWKRRQPKVQDVITQDEGQSTDVVEQAEGAESESEASQWPDLETLLFDSADAKKAYIQARIKQLITSALNGTLRPLTTTELNQIRTQAQNELITIQTKGFSIPAIIRQHLYGNLTPTRSFDGAVYLTAAIIDHLPAKQAESADEEPPQPITEREAQNNLTVREALIQRFGPNWYRYRGARAAFYCLMGDSGENQIQLTYADYILNVNTARARRRLQQLGVPDNLI